LPPNFRYAKIYVAVRVDCALPQEEMLPGDEGITVIAGGEDFVTPPLYKRIAAKKWRCRIIDFATSLSVQDGRRASYAWLIGPDAEVVFADPLSLSCDMGLFGDAEAIINLSNIFSSLDYEAFPAEGLRRNVYVTLELMESASKAGVGRFIHFSSGVVYGPRREQPLPEIIPPDAVDLQAAFNVAAESIVSSYSQRGKMETVILRLFNAYGPGQSSEAIVPYIIRGALSGKPFPMGNTNHTRDFLYIDDMVDGIMLALQKPEASGKVLNLASGVETQIKSIINLIEELTGQDIEVNFDPERIRINRPDFPRWVADITAAREVLGFSPRCGLKDGLVRTIESIKRPEGRMKG